MLSPKPIPVFVHIPKTAGKSVREALKSVPNVMDIQHSTISMQQRKFGNQGRVFPDNIYAFCFVRNPYKRLRSSFYHLSEIPEEKRKSKKNKDFNSRRFELKDKYNFNFKKFVLDQGFEKYEFGHFRPQTHWIFDKNNERIVDFIGRFECLNSDFRTLYAHLTNGDQKELEHINKTKTSKYKATNDEWSDEMIALVQQFYKKDFEVLSYSLDLKDARKVPQGSLYDTV